MPRIPYLFEDQEQVIQTETWRSYLWSNARTYQHCVVKSLTHVKNLHSELVHEYLQVIVEDTSTGIRTRLLAEREREQDQVIIGRWVSMHRKSALPYTSKSGLRSTRNAQPDNLPLPLYSLKFTGNKFNVIYLADILKNTTIAGGHYHLLSKNCYWFARTVYDTIPKLFSCVEKPWTFARWRGLFILFKKRAESTASEFEAQTKKSMVYLSDAVSKMFSTPQTAVSFQPWVKAVCDDSHSLLVDTEHATNDKIEPGLKLILKEYSGKEPDVKFNLDVEAVFEEVSQQRDSSGYKKIYKNCASHKTVEEVPLRDKDTVQFIPEKYPLTESQVTKMNEALEVMVGFVLSKCLENPDFSRVTKL
ncbi:hypothetical protein MHUMG1_09041 [Metarhizium humberi]|uniref:Uncharacterized protein n=1 Tax=Metarhizium humberi TaxID=2596975 RepID=A0A9P8M5R4_9HYPO|nr:hypothetical protein MHUMG1_09041 [Metarhizium humberi]